MILTMTTGLERAQVLRFPTASDTRTARPRRRTLRDMFAIRRSRVTAHRLTVVNQAAAPAAPVVRRGPAPRARDVHDHAMLRGVIPPSF